LKWENRRADCRVSLGILTTTCIIWPVAAPAGDRVGVRYRFRDKDILTDAECTVAHSGAPVVARVTTVAFRAPIPVDVARRARRAHDVSNRDIDEE